MKIWAISDLHLSLGNPDKKMDVFGNHWNDHHEKIKENWTNNIHNDDIVLIAGDISWAKDLENAKNDLEWVHQLPGKKVLLRGNHDYWWKSASKIKAILPDSIDIIQNNALTFDDITIAGARLWDSSQYNFDKYIKVKQGTELITAEHSPENLKIFQRELQRLEISLKSMCKNAKYRIVMTHYPPIDAALNDSETSILLEKYNVNLCVFGHLHSLKKNIDIFGKKNNINYVLSSCDHINFNPVMLL